MKLAIVAGGWHWPGKFFQNCPKGADRFVIAHRDPSLPEVAAEKSVLTGLDRALYAWIPNIADLTRLGWHYETAPNVAGDWVFFNQWLERHDYRQYDWILNCHDDTYVRAWPQALDPDALLIANGRYPEAPAGYVRGSCEFWSRSLLDMLGGRIPLPELSLTREGATDSPADFNALSSWNAIGDPVRKFLADNELLHRVHYLSAFYRVSPYFIEGERGLIESRIGAPWSFDAGMKAHGLAT